MIYLVIIVFLSTFWCLYHVSQDTIKIEKRKRRLLEKRIKELEKEFIRKE